MDMCREGILLSTLEELLVGTKGCPSREKKWHHIAVTYEGKVSTCISMGNYKMITKLKRQASWLWLAFFYVGSRHTRPGEDYLGLVDELAVYSGVLGEKKIKDIMGNGVLD